MLLLLGLPIWVVLLNLVMKPNLGSKQNAKQYMFLCSAVIVLIMGLRGRYVGSADTKNYCDLFETAQAHMNLFTFLRRIDIFEDGILFSEAGFFVFTWISARILPGAQWFLLLTSLIIVALTAKFIWDHSENYCISWLVFLCLGSMTFAMNGMRQALAMSICLMSYQYAKEKRPLPFALLVLTAFSFHTSALFFAVVYVMRNMKMNFRSIVLLVAGVLVFMMSADRLAFLYDDMTGEDYSSVGAFDSGGVVTLLVYLIAIVMAFVCSKRLEEKDMFVPLALVALGMVIYTGRYISTQIYERMSYYFFYFLMILFPTVFSDLRPWDRMIVRLCFSVLAIALFAYRLRDSSFANFELFW